MTFAEELRKQENDMNKKELDRISNFDAKILSESIEAIKYCCERCVDKHELAGVLELDDTSYESYVHNVEKTKIPKKYRLERGYPFPSSYASSVHIRNCSRAFFLVNPTKFEEQFEREVKKLGFTFSECSLIPVTISKPDGTIPILGSTIYSEIGTAYIIWIDVKW